MAITPFSESGALSAAGGLGVSALNEARLHSSRPEEVERAAGGFEALLLHQMLKSMWETVTSANLLGEDTNQAQIYRDMFSQAVADTVAQGRGIGVKEFLTSELVRNYGASKR